MKFTDCALRRRSIDIAALRRSMAATPSQCVLCAAAHMANRAALLKGAQTLSPSELMGQDEAVALLLDLAGVEKVSYTKKHPESQWPPAGAYQIVSECGQLPITLTIAAQVVRSWGTGWGEWLGSASITR